MIIGAGKLAKFTDGCATVTFKDTTVMATAVSCDKGGMYSGFVPLTVSFQQKAAALGRIPLNFLRRELGQNENEILISRMIDRSLRPLFPANFNNETQIVCNPLAMDGENFPDVLSINAASAALAVSNIPWNGPVGAVRVGLVDDNIIINPDKNLLSKSSLNLVVVSKAKHYVVMLEGSCSNILLNDLLRAIKKGVSECQKIIISIEHLASLCGKLKKEVNISEINEELYQSIQMLASEPLNKIFQNSIHDKLSRDTAISEVRTLIEKKFSDKCENFNQIFSLVCKEVFRNYILINNIRCDGRLPVELRNIECESNLFKPLHGSALFQRGQTQVFCTVALDSPSSALKMDRISMLTR